MKIDIIEKKENKLLERTEITAKVDHVGQPVPKREDFMARLAALLNKEKDQVVLIKLEAKYGEGRSLALVHVYETAERAIAVEKEFLLKRSGIIKEKAE
ncbi:MAG: 30S ribosomal protein S24e [Candidatus Heimdallarchaeota archaeon]|nr:30S ribosomal protein S24e [Candidatus Heimdallarchaeota archaeon]